MANLYLISKVSLIRNRINILLILKSTKLNLNAAFFHLSDDQQTSSIIGSLLNIYVLNSMPFFMNEWKATKINGNERLLDVISYAGYCKMLVIRVIINK